MSETILGVLIGGIIGLVSVWLASWLQRKESARVLRATILAELEAHDDLLARRQRADPILEFLEGWEKSKSAPFARLFAETLTMEPSVAFPVYYARVGDLGLLGPADSFAVIHHYSEAMGLLRSARLILDSIRTDADTSDAARQLKEDYLRIAAGRDALIRQLRRTSVMTRPTSQQPSLSEHAS